MISDYIYSVYRVLLMRKFTGNIGKIVEKDDYIECYVQDYDFMKLGEDLYVHCAGLDNTKIKLAKKYDVYKPIKYIFNNIIIDDNVIIEGNNNCILEFNNCIFNGDFNLNIDGVSDFNKCAIKSKGKVSFKANSICFDECYINSLDNMNFNNTSISIDGNEDIRINNSNIGRLDDNVNLYLNSKGELDINNSNMYGDNVYVDTEKFTVSDDILVTFTNNLEVSYTLSLHNKIHKFVTLNGYDVNNYLGMDSESIKR